MRVGKSSGIIKFKALLIAAVTFFFAFERVIISYIPIAGYIDELFVIISCAIAVYTAFMESQRYTAGEIAALILTGLVIVVGILGNCASGIMQNPFLIAVDIISTVKVIIAYYWIIGFRMSTDDWDDVIRLLAKWIRAAVMLMFVLFVMAYVLKLPLLGEVRYGIKSYRFLFNNPGNFSKLFYFIVPLLTADLQYGNTVYKKVMLGIALLIWFMTMRSRAIAFVACYLLFAFWYFYIKEKHIKKVNIVYVIPIGVICLLLGWRQLIFYFTNETQTRSALLRYGVVTMKEYFPIGSGFGTYASDIAKTHYSPLYTQYGFLNIYGMGKTHTNFLNDNYWPMIMGQFGIIGTILVIAILVLLYREMIKNVLKNRYLYLSALCMTAFLVISSIASKSYSEFSMIPIFMIHGIFVQRERSRTISSSLKKKEN